MTTDVAPKNQNQRTVDDLTPIEKKEILEYLKSHTENKAIPFLINKYGCTHLTIQTILLKLHFS